MPYNANMIEQHHLLSEFSRNEDRMGMRDPDSFSDASSSPKGHADQEKRVRREIANSNERRRMQSINAGFLSLRSLLPQHEGEKLSKAAILQQTTEYVRLLEKDRGQLMGENTKLRQFLAELGHRVDPVIATAGSPAPKRKKTETESSDEGISMSYEDQTIEELRRELADAKCQIERECRMGRLLRERVHSLEAQLLTHQFQENIDQMRTQINKESNQSEFFKPEEVNMKSSPSVTIKMEPIIKSPIIPNVPISPSAETSMSRRNLETIVEAIRHLEGENILEKPEVGTIILHDDIESEDTNTASSEPEEQSESSGRDSPTTYFRPNAVRTVVTNSERYPIALQLLHRPINEHYVQHTGVILQPSP